MLSAISVSAGHPDRASCLRDVSLTLESGRVAALVGASGSGKSTLLDTLAGVLAPRAGSVSLDGTPLPARPGAGFPDVGYLVQLPERQLFALDVFGEVAFGARKAGLTGVALREAVDRALASVGLDPARIGARAPLGLSLGERRRVALASVLVFEPRVLLLDEPTAAMDAEGEARLASIVAARARAGAAVLAAGHDLSWLLRIADRLLLLDGGALETLSLGRSSDRARLARAGQRLPSHLALFSGRCPDLLLAGGWRTDVGPAAARFGATLGRRGRC